MKMPEDKANYKKYAESKMSSFDNNTANRFSDPRPLSKQGMEELKIRITELSTKNIDIALTTIRSWLKDTKQN